MVEDMALISDLGLTSFNVDLARLHSHEDDGKRLIVNVGEDLGHGFLVLFGFDSSNPQNAH